MVAKKLFLSPEELRRLYWDEELSTVEIGRIHGVHASTVQKRMVKYGIEARSEKEAAELLFEKDPGRRRRLSKAHKGKSLSKSHRKSISKGMQMRKKLNPLFGKALRTEQQRRHSRLIGRKIGNQHLREKVEKLGNSIVIKEHKEREHDKLVDEEAENLKTQRFKVIVLHHGNPVPDIIALKHNKVYAVEVETGKRIQPDFEKYLDASCYDDVIWVIIRGKLEG